MENIDFKQKKKRAYSFSTKIYLTAFQMNNDNPAVDEIFNEIYNYYAEKLAINGCLFANYIVYSKDYEGHVKTKRFNEARAFTKAFAQYFEKDTLINKFEEKRTSGSYILMINPFKSAFNTWKLRFILPTGFNGEAVINHFKEAIDKQVEVKRQQAEEFYAKQKQQRAADTPPNPTNTPEQVKVAQGKPAPLKAFINPMTLAFLEPTTFHRIVDDIVNDNLPGFNPGNQKKDIPAWVELEDFKDVSNTEPEAIKEPTVDDDTQHIQQYRQEDTQTHQEQETETEEVQEDEEEKHEEIDNDALMRELEALDDNI